MDLKALNQSLFKPARRYAYALALVFLIAAVALSLKGESVDQFKLANDVGFISFMFLSLTLLVTPVRTLFPQFALNPSLYRARRALGVSGFAFAAVHYLLQFSNLFKLDFSKVMTANARNGNALVAALLALFLLFLLAITSFDWTVRKLGKRWFTLHKAIYLAYPLIIYHVVKAGIDFKTLNAFSGLFFAIGTITILFELARVYMELTKPRAQTPPIQPSAKKVQTPTVPTGNLPQGTD